MNKPVILFTNFWDANKLLQTKHFVFWKGNSLYKVKMNDDPKNYSVLSIALRHPSLDKLPVIKETHSHLPRLDFFCPTYEMLKDYKGGGKWSDYVVKYKQLMRDRRTDITEWVKSLIPDHVYILCCWENTSKGANCHRKLVFEALSKSKTLRDKAIYTHRDGSWHDDYISTSFYQHMESNLISHGNQNVTIIPVTVGSLGISNQTEIPLDTVIGDATPLEDGGWGIAIHPEQRQAIEELLGVTGTTTYGSEGVDYDYSGNPFT